MNFNLKKKWKKKIRAKSHRALKAENKNSFGKTLWPFCHLHEGANAGWLNGWMDGWMDKLMDGWMDKLMDEWMDGWLDGICVSLLWPRPLIPGFPHLDLFCLFVFNWRKLLCKVVLIPAIQKPFTSLSASLGLWLFSSNLCSQSVGGWEQTSKANGQLEDKDTSSVEDDFGGAPTV